MALIGSTLLILVVLSFVLTIIQTVNLRVFLKKGRPVPSLRRYPPVSIIKPLKGADARLVENLESFCAIDYPDYELILAVADPPGPVLPLVRQFLDRHGREKVKLVVDPTEIGLNPQINNLNNGYRAAAGEIVVFTDSDTRATPDYIRRLIGPLEDEGTGLTSALAVYRGARGFWSWAKSVTYNTSVPLYNALWCRFWPVTVGAAMAVPRRVLEKIGGLQPIADRLTTDQELGKLVARQGYGIRLVPLLIAMDEDYAPFRFHASQTIRWMVAIKSSSPIGYHFIPFANTAFLGGLFWLLAPANPFHIAVLLGAAVSRTLTPLVLNRPLIEDPRIGRHAWMAVPMDFVFISLWFVGHWRRRITWRGTEYAVRKGKMVPVEDASDEGPVPA